jgi:hypothetical protein
MSSQESTGKLEGMKQQTKQKKIKKLILVESIKTKRTRIKNKGTGADCSNTNKTGLSYEEITKLDDKIKIIEKNKFANIIKFNNNKRLFTKTKQYKILLLSSTFNFSCFASIGSFPR